MGEVLHSSQPWLNGDEFSGVMNYGFPQQIEDHFLTGKQTAAEMTALLTDQLILYRDQTNQVMLNMLDSHDTLQLLTVAGDDIDLVLQALTFAFLQTGTPCLYYGTEMGMDGENDPDDRKPMDWTKIGQPIWQRVAKLIGFRREHAATLGRGTAKLEVTPSGLIKVVHHGRETLTAYFNTTASSVPLTAAPVLHQGFA